MPRSPPRARAPDHRRDPLQGGRANGRRDGDRAARRRNSFLFLLIAGVAYPFALAFVVAVCDLIPQIGATLGGIVVVVAGFATSVPVGIAALIFCVLYQQLENYLTYLACDEASVKVSDLAALWPHRWVGVVGALIAIPAVAAIQLIAPKGCGPRQQTRQR